MTETAGFVGTAGLTESSTLAEKSQLAEASALAFRYADRLLLGTVRDTHRAIASRVFGATGELGATPRRMHDDISDAVYDGIRRVGAVAGLAAQTGFRELAQHRGGGELERSPAGRQVVSAVNALIGDALVTEGNPLAIRMSLRKDGRDLSLDPDDLRAAYPDCDGRLVLFVHGLGENDDCWKFKAAEEGGTYGDRLATELGWTPLYLRFNTGQHIWENGRELAELLELVCLVWPRPVREIALVGHSLGGLVVRSACHVASSEAHAWADLVRDVVFLGTPLLGAPLEKVVNAGSWLLRRFPESSAFATILNTRSVGIKDLRHGYVCAEDWADADLDDVFRCTRVEIPPLPQVTYHLVAATLGVDPRHPLSEVVGDLMVRHPSAVGRGRRGKPIIEMCNVRHHGSANHFTLLNHAAIYADLREWLA